MYIPKHLKLIRVSDKGRAIFAQRSIKKNAVIVKISGYIADDEISSPEALQIDDNTFIDSKRWHLDDFINHSCQPNAYIDFEALCIRALLDIKKDEEITFNYNTAEYDLTHSATPSFFRCHCNAKKCIGAVKGFRFLRVGQKKELEHFLSPFLKKKLKENR